MKALQIGMTICHEGKQYEPVAGRTRMPQGEPLRFRSNDDGSITVTVRPDPQCLDPEPEKWWPWGIVPRALRPQA